MGFVKTFPNYITKISGLSSLPENDILCNVIYNSEGGVLMTEMQYSAASFLTPSDTPCEQLIYMTSAVFGEDWEYTLHSHSFAEVFFVTSGEGYFCTSDAEVPIQTNTLVLINPNTLHTERSCGDTLLTYIILGIDNLFFHFRDQTGSRFHTYDFKNHKDAVLPDLNLMLGEAQGRHQASYKICNHYMSVFFNKVHRILDKSLDLYSVKNYPDECTAVKNYIKEHFADDITLDTLAGYSGFNKYYLSRMFSRAYGIAPINYLLECRILHSEVLLKTTDFSITQISCIVGFSSANYFSQSFKRYTGMTPLSYRETHII